MGLILKEEAGPIDSKPASLLLSGGYFGDCPGL